MKRTIKLVLLIALGLIGPMRVDAFTGTNGMGDNGMGDNGMGDNGMGDNGMGDNGLGDAGFNDVRFLDWISGRDVDSTLGDIATSTERAHTFKYVYGCAAGRDDYRSVTIQLPPTPDNPSGLVTYKFHGNYGLLPSWVQGQPLTFRGKEILLACLAAHVNPEGQTVPISFRGWKESGDSVDMYDGEQSAYSVRSACFLAYQDNDSIFVAGAGGYDYGVLPFGEGSESRTCVNVYGGIGLRCPHVPEIGICNDYCEVVGGTGPGTGVFANCVVNGTPAVAYTVYLMPQ